mgnify:CR=1 FL=1
MDKKDILSRVDHTLLKQTATWEQIEKLCREGMEYAAASVCIPPCYVKQAKDFVGDKLAVCTVIGFPNGNMTTAVKVFETEDAVKNGADEIDMVINIGLVKAGHYDQVLDEIRQIKAACGGRCLKVIIETCLLTEEEKKEMCRVVTESGADFIKTSTGKQQPAATPEAALVMCQAIKEYHELTGIKVGFKPAGGINCVNDALIYYTIVKEVLGEEWLNNELFRLGTSRLANLLLSEIKGEEMKFF